MVSISSTQNDCPSVQCDSTRAYSGASLVIRPSRIFRGVIFANREVRYPLARLAGKLPPNPHYDTVLEWCKLGKRSDSGKIVKMEAVRGTAGLESSVEAYHRFIERLNEE